MWHVRLWIGVARPRARGRKRFSVGPSSTRISETRISSPTRSWLFSAFAAADSISFWMSRATPRGENCQQGAGLLDVEAANLVGDQARLARGDPDVLRARAHGRQVFDLLLARALLLGLGLGHSRYSPFDLEWERKVRVGANSPSLWPTIDSEM